MKKEGQIKQFVKKILFYALAAIILAAIFVVQPPTAPKAQAGGFDSSNLIDDAVFINRDSLTLQGIQDFLSQKGGFLASYSEGGRSAAQIIFDAAAGRSSETPTSLNGITVNSATGTVNPYVILTTLQKEQSLITMTSRNDDVLRKAMGYGCPDSGSCNPSYAGFTRQVEWGAWQLRYNYERAQGYGFGDYQVGQGFCFSDWNGTNCGTFGNRATSALYRYTPHVYNGNINFWSLFNQYSKSYSASYADQNGYPTLMAGQSYNFVLSLRNSGTMTWDKNTVRLGTDRSRDRVSAFVREGDGPSGWMSPQRVVMQQASVAPGETATFSFWMQVPSNLPAGTYREYFRPVADNIMWMEDMGIFWDVKVITLPDAYHYAYIGQSGYPTLSAGQSNNFTLTVKNTGSITWQQSIVHFGTDRPKNRISDLIREGDGPSGWISPDRIKMQQGSVAPGETATFSFWMKIPAGQPVNTYSEYFRVVADGITWLEDYGIYWNVAVR